MRSPAGGRGVLADFRRALVVFLSGDPPALLAHAAVAAFAKEKADVERNLRAVKRRAGLTRGGDTVSRNPMSHVAIDIGTGQMVVR